MITVRPNSLLLIFFIYRCQLSFLSLCYYNFSTKAFNAVFCSFFPFQNIHASAVLSDYVTLIECDKIYF